MDTDPASDHEPAHRRGRKMLAIGVSMLVLAGAGFAVWRAFAPLRPAPLRSGATDDGYYLRFTDAISATSDPNGGADLVLDTNLPDGTIVLQQDAETGVPGGRGMGLGSAVQGGHLPITVGDQSCYATQGAPRSTGFTVTITVRPVFDNVAFDSFPLPNGSPRPPPGQPPEVLGILGDRFQNLTGDQVTTDGDVRQMVVTLDHQWPDDVCAGYLASNVPTNCGPNGEAVSGDHSADDVAASVIGVLEQTRMCELWGATTPDFQAANPWSTVRDAWLTWVQGLGSLAGPPGHEQDTPLSFRIVSMSQETFAAPTSGTVLPESLVADYSLNDALIAEAEFVHTGPTNDGAVPQFRIARFNVQP
jgi:hypothetical protein